MATTEQLHIAGTEGIAKDSAAIQHPAFIDALRSMAIVASIGIVVYRHVLSKLALDLWKDPNYSHGFVMPVFVGFVVWKMRDRLIQLKMQPSWWGFVLAIVGIGLFVLGNVGAELFSSRISILFFVASVVLLFLGWNHLRTLAFPLAMLLLMIPIPTIAMNQLTFPLQLNASQLATGLLSSVGVPVLRDGNVIQLPATSLEVVEACSGIRSLISLIALAAVFGYLKNHAAWRRWLLVVLAVPIAVVANAVRIMGTGLLAEYWDPDKAEGFFHMFEGWVIFLLSLLLLLASDKVVSWISALRKEPHIDEVASCAR